MQISAAKNALSPVDESLPSAFFLQTWIARTGKKLSNKCFRKWQICERFILYVGWGSEQKIVGVGKGGWEGVTFLVVINWIAVVWNLQTCVVIVKKYFYDNQNNQNSIFSDNYVMSYPYVQ
jgi:hypothetical protein